ncbi:MAG: EutN/CcmL family microcompartment protein [Clostridiales Family XIII bacterium]|jgi:microcompartment protein CcmK/EutM|nr:EutN/CcmL family microcompartment protein [Clostridiales Family XIII bacterium]
MYTGKVVGNVVATVKDASIEGIPLLLVQKIENGVPKGIIVAADSTRQAGKDDFVYLIGSKEAARMFRKGNTPVDAAIVGFIDDYNEPDRR